MLSSKKIQHKRHSSSVANSNRHPLGKSVYRWLTLRLVKLILGRRSHLRGATLKFEASLVVCFTTVLNEKSLPNLKRRNSSVVGENHYCCKGKKCINLFIVHFPAINYVIVVWSVAGWVTIQRQCRSALWARSISNLRFVEFL